MIQPFLEALAIPNTCTVNKPIFKKHFYENTDLDPTSKKALRADINKIKWLYALKPSTVNCNAYRDAEREYDEIAYLQIELSNTIRRQKIATFVNKAIPYPLVILFTFDNHISIAIADKRINQADKTKWVIEDIWITHWFNPRMPNEHQTQFMQDMTMKNLSFSNFYAFYTDIKHRVIALNASDKSGFYRLTSHDTTINRANALRELDKLEQEKSELQNKLAKETQIGQQVEISTKIKQYADQITSLKEKL